MVDNGHCQGHHLLPYEMKARSYPDDAINNTENCSLKAGVFFITEFFVSTKSYLEVPQVGTEFLSSKRD